MTSPLLDGPTSPFEMEDTPSDNLAAAPPDDSEDYEGLGRLLQMAAEDPEKAAKEIVKEWERQDPAMNRRKVFWDANTLMRRGVRGVRVTYPNRQDLNTVQLYVPLGALDNVSPLNRADILCTRVTDHLLSDPPAPEPSASTDSDGDRDAAEFSKRVLLEESGEGGCNYQAKFRRGHNKAATYGSAFLYVWTDPTGGGQATQADLGPTNGPEAMPLDGAPDDPLSEAPPVGEGDVGDGLATAPEAPAPEPIWKPKLKIDVLDGRHVRFLPEQVDGIADADGCLILRVRTLGQLRNQFSNLRPKSPDYIGDDAILAMVNWRTVAMQWVLPWYAKLGYSTQPTFDEEGNPADSTLCGLIGCYYVANPAYPKGAYLLAAGDAHLLHASPWIATVETAQGQEQDQPMDLPLAQIRQHDDTDGDDPYGWGDMVIVGPADEVRGTIVLAKLDHVDRFSRPNTFLPLGTIVQPEALTQRSGEPIYFNTAGIPVVETVPPFDATSMEFMTEAGAYQDDAIGLQETAQAGESPNSVSGKAKEIVINQSRINLSGQIQNLADGCERCWRLMLQQIRAYWTVPQRMQFTTDDGEYAEKAWTRSDLGGTVDVKIAVGSFTQQTSTQKIQQAIQYSEVPGLIADPDELHRIVSNAISPELGLIDNPVIQRVRGQIAVWKDGPPPGWLEAFQAFQMGQQQIQAQIPPGAPPELAQMAVQQAGLQPPPTPFTRVPSDEEPKAALFRHRELFRLTQTKAFEKWDPAWQGTALTEYEAMRQAAIPVAPWLVTAKEQQMAAQAQQQAEMQKAQMGIDAKQASGPGGKAMDHQLERGHDGRVSGIKSRPAQRQQDQAPQGPPSLSVA